MSGRGAMDAADVATACEREAGETDPRPCLQDAPPSPLPPLPCSDLRLPSGVSGASAGVAVALGANLGDPAATLIAVRPLLAALLQRLLPPPCHCRWSPLFRTAPVGGPPDQPAYLNAAVLVMPPHVALPRSGLEADAPVRPANGLAMASPSPDLHCDPLQLLEQLQALEQRFGRVRRQRWGPRTLDLDLLWCGDQALQVPRLQVPHPRLAERTFVLAPLAAIAPSLVPPLPAQPPQTCGDRLATLLAQTADPPPLRLPPQPGWPE